MTYSPEVIEATRIEELHRECDNDSCWLALKERENTPAYFSAAEECEEARVVRPLVDALKVAEGMATFFKRMAGAFGVDVETFRKDGVDAEEILSLLAQTIRILDKSETAQGARAADAIRFLVKTYSDNDERLVARADRLREYAVHRGGCLGDLCSFGPMKYRSLCKQPKDGCHPNHEYVTHCECGLAELLEGE